MTDVTQSKGVRISRRRVIVGGVAGAFLVCNVVAFALRWPTFRELFVARSFKMNFEGPFSYEERLLDSKVEKAGIELRNVTFSNSDFGDLRLEYVFTGEVNPDRVVAVTVIAIGVDGVEHVLLDAQRADPRLAKPRLMGSMVSAPRTVCDDVLGLPCEPGKLMSLEIRFAESDAKTLAKEDNPFAVPLR